MISLEVNMASVSSNAKRSEVQGIQTMPAQSSWISMFEYEPTTHLRDGSIYQHTFTTPMDWENLKTAPNHSKHWAVNIKGRKLGIRVKSAKSPNAEIKLGGM